MIGVGVSIMSASFAAGGPIDIPAPTVPAQMSAPSLAVDSPTQITATLASAPDDGGSAITEYDLRYRTTPSGSWTVVQDITSPVPISGLSASTEYEVQTRAQNAVGNGPWSAGATATTAVAAPTVSLTPTSDTIPAGTTGQVATITFGGGAADSVTLTGPNAGLFNPSGTSLNLVSAAVEGSYSVTVNVSNAAGSATATFNLTVEEAFALNTTPGSVFELTGLSGTVTVTVTAPPAYANYDAGNGAGVFVFQASDLASGPVNLVPPQIIDDGTPAETENMTLTPGLWIYDPDNGGIGTPTYQWQADTAGNGSFANIPGATSTSYTLTSGEAGDDVRVQESLSDNGGSRTATSDPVSVAGGSVTSPTRLDGGTQIEARGSDTNTHTPSTQYTVPGGSDRLMVAAMSSVWITTAPTLPTLSFGGTQMTLEGVVSDPTSGSAWVALYSMKEADIPAGAQSFDIDMLTTMRGVCLSCLTYSGVNQATSTAFNAGTPAAGGSASYSVGLNVNDGSAIVSVGGSREPTGGEPTTVTGDAVELLEIPAPGNNRPMQVLASAENTTAGAKTITYTTDTALSNPACAAAIEVFGI